VAVAQGVGAAIQGVDWKTVATIAPTAVAVVALTTLGLNFVAARRQRIALTLSLHEFYLGHKFYAKVRGPSYGVATQWRWLPENIREEYRKIVAQGWVGGASSDLKRYVPDAPTEIGQLEKSHYQIPRARRSLTEHQALTAALRFWSRVNTHIERRTADRKLVRELFRDEYHYVAEFYCELAEYVTRELAGDAGSPRDPPRWVKDVVELRAFFARRSLLQRLWPLRGR
jgi:hypothetical protein